MYRKTSIQAQQNFNKRGKILQAVWLYFMLPPLGRTLWIKKKTANALIQFRTLRKLCWLVRSNISRNPMASLKNAVVRLRNLEHTGKQLLCEIWKWSTTSSQTQVSAPRFTVLTSVWVVIRKKKFPHKEIQCVGFMRLLGRVYWQIGDIILAEIKFDILNYVFISV